MQRKKEHDVSKKIVEPDNELLLWEEWIKIRKDETSKLGKIVHKSPADLTMNLVENIREDKERKIALEHSKIDKKPTVRGTLWEQPVRLHQKCNCEPVYEVQRTSVEKGKPHIIEHIGVPQYIQVTEKGVSGIPKRLSCEKLNSEYYKYRDKKEKELKEKIYKIDPYRPDVANLIVKGTKPKPPPKKIPPLPSIIVTQFDQTEDVLSGVYAIKINNTVIFKDTPGLKLIHLKGLQQENCQENCKSWTYYFKTPVRKAGRAKLSLENLGTVTLRYCWKKIIKPISFIPKHTYEQVFFFNKNENVLYPGQKRKISFTFVSEKPGIFNEIWEFSISNTYFFDNLEEKLLINFSADAIENIVKTKIDILKSRIETKSVYNMVTRMLTDIITKVQTIEPEIYPYKKMLLEADMFVMKNPVCFYHQTEVMRMKELYTEMNPGELWDLSINTWRGKMMQKEYDERMTFYECLRVSHTDLLKPWYEGDELLQQKYRTVKWFLGNLADQFDKQYDSLMELYTPSNKDLSTNSSNILSVSTMKKPLNQEMRNLFYLRVYEYVSTALEECVGALSSLDLSRWIEFDFCRW